MEHWNRDLNIGGLIRNANAFNAYEVFYIGRRNWDRRGAVGSYHYLRIQHFPDFEGFHAHVDDLGYTLIGVDNTDDAEPIDETELPQRALFLFGEEGDGLTPEAIAAVERIVYIKQYGSVRSLNAATASGITMYEWSKQHR